ncbi:MAG: efflux RND transporter periplasmic adaptor subunit [Planctomycetes bacterium]|nr:efflux RND transporter periplasmic adaptor subunit [Planctomycetota bacterium]
MKANLALTGAMAGLLLVVAAGAWFYLRLSDPSGAAPGDAAATPLRQDRVQHGRSIAIGDNPVLCPNHGIPEVACPFCDPGLIQERGYCGGHDVAEALCTRCNPVLIAAFKVEGDWCAEHGLPDSQCVVCNAPLAAAGVPTLIDLPGEPPRRAPQDDEVLRWKRTPSSGCTKTLSIVRLDSPDVARAAGLAFEKVVARPVRETISCNVEVAFNGNRYARLAARASGVVSAVHRDLGDHVAPGDVLATVDSVALGSAKAEYLQALTLLTLWEKNHAREQALEANHVATARDVLEAETKLVESRIALDSSAQKLRNLGLSEEAIRRVADDNDTSSGLAVTAPFAGVVVERDAVIGEVVDTARPLFAIADTSTMWAWLDLYEADMARVRIGQRVEIGIEGLGDRVFTGTATWISAHVDPRTRTLKVRVTVDNVDGLLRANMFGHGQITVRQRDEAIVIPKSAVQWEGCCNVVFVRHTDTVYQPYKVDLGYEGDGFYVVEKGLSAGEMIVTQGAFLLKTEILKGNIGAGCCEVDPGANRNAE